MNRALLWAAGPVVVFAAVAVAFFATDPLRPFVTGAPPVESLTFERAVLDRDGITLAVRAEGSEPVRIAQVQVDGAYWARRAGAYLHSALFLDSSRELEGSIEHRERQVPPMDKAGIHRNDTGKDNQLRRCPTESERDQRRDESRRARSSV